MKNGARAIEQLAKIVEVHIGVQFGQIVLCARARALSARAAAAAAAAVFFAHHQPVLAATLIEAVEDGAQRERVGHPFENGARVIERNDGICAHICAQV